MNQPCAECLSPSPDLVRTRAGESVCPACAAEHYIACGDCRGLVARDESRDRDGVAYCVECHDRLFAPKENDGVSSDDLEALVAEYVRLDAEAKRIGERLETIKDLLKAVASNRERVAGAVTLGAGEATVKCTFTTSYKVDAASAEALETALGAERFAELFERKVTVGANKTNVEQLLKGVGDADTEARDAVRSLVDVVESARLLVQRPRKGKAGGDEA
jgi:hypothetical protein